MNTYKAILDTRRPNGVIATITQFDNATLSLQIVTNGEIEQPWEAPQFELIAMKRDQQAVRESDQAAFTINDAGEHRVTVELKEQFLTCRGSVKMQFIVKDGDRLSTSIFYVMVGESLDHDIIESHRDVAVLDELETYVKQGFDDLAYQEQRMKDVEKATHELNELMVGNEAERQAAEANRQALFEGNESQRQNTFNQQLTSQRREFEDSQADREGTFNALKQSLSSDFNAAQNEREREFDRVMASNQTQFNDAETSRATTFSHRQLENERTFTANENARQTLFNDNEAGRQTNEAGRVSNENTRKTNEAERVAAEANRQQKMSEFEAKATQLSDELDAQVARVDAFVSANEEKLLGDRDKVDYMGNTHESVKAASDANVDWLLGEMNTAHYEGQHITATETIEGHAKSAILKGLTLVNLSENLNTITRSLDWWYREEKLMNSIEKLKRNTYYTILYRLENISGNHQHYNGIGLGIGMNGYDKDIPGINDELDKNGGWCKVRFQLTDDFIEQFPTYKQLHIRPIRRSTTPVEGESIDYTIKGFTILEGDYITNPIPFNEVFEGMQSVKMPVLTTTGKNLWDKKNFVNGVIDGESIRVSASDLDDTRFYYDFKENQQYVFTLTSYSENKKLVYFRYNYTDGTNSGFTFFIPYNGERKHFLSDEGKTISYISFVFSNHDNYTLSNVQLEEGSVATPYEPYKTNILTVNEPIELRGIGDVRDTIDCLTGQMTERISEGVLNGSENWILNSSKEQPNHWCFHNNQKLAGSELLISDRFPQCDTDGDRESIRGGGDYIFVYISKEKVDGNDESFKQWLSQNPIKYQYTKSEESTKTVDLSDNHVYSYKDVTHYDCSSAEGSLVPTLSIDVPTNLPAVVTRQRATIQELEKENVALKNEIEETANSSVNGDLELMSSQFELDFRLFEIEMNLDMPMMATMRGVKSMAMTVYQQAKTLILAGKYEREDMEYKLSRYKAAGRITVEEYDELIALMDARELVD